MDRIQDIARASGGEADGKQLVSELLHVHPLHIPNPDCAKAPGGSS